MDWKTEALKLYQAGSKITDIAKRIGKSRKTVSEYINSLSDLVVINAARKDAGTRKRREYKRDWKRRSSAVDAALLKRQHNIDVMVLSREQYFND